MRSGYLNVWRQHDLHLADKNIENEREKKRAISRQRKKIKEPRIPQKQTTYFAFKHMSNVNASKLKYPLST